MKLVAAGVADVEVLAALSITTFCETFWDFNNPQDMAKYISEEMSVEKLTQELTDGNNKFWIAAIDNEPVGYAKMRTARSADCPKECNPAEIERIYVLAEFQGKNIGAGVMSQCIQVAAGLGFDVIWLGVWEHNRKAIDFYNKWGFRVFGSHPFRLGDDVQTDILMMKDINPGS